MHPSWHSEQLLFARPCFFPSSSEVSSSARRVRQQTQLQHSPPDLSGRTCTLGIIADIYRNAFLFGLRMWAKGARKQPSGFLRTNPGTMNGELQ